MEQSFLDYINNIKQNKLNQENYINSLSQEVLNIIKEPNELNKLININSFKLIPYFEKFLFFENKSESKNEINDNNIIIYNNDYSILNYKEFEFDLDLTNKIKPEELDLHIKKLLSIKFSNISTKVNKLSLSLFITSLIEKILVSIHKKHSNQILPRTLSEILMLIASENIFPSGLINLCIILIGPPTGINLRNLLWHGFFNDDQFTDTFLCLLILLYQTLMQYDNKNYEYKKLKDIHIQYLNSFCSIENDLIISEINRCQYIIPYRRKEINNCISNVNLEKNSEEKILNLFRLIVEFEHFIRISFISINDINPKFGMANYSSYYITLDVFFQEYIFFNNDGIMVNRPSTKNENKITKYKNAKKFVNKNDDNCNLDNKNTFEKKENKLIKILGDEIIIKLYDLFFLENGIKLRDYLSHGEYDINTLPDSTEKGLLFIWYVILVKINDYFYKTNTNLETNIMQILDIESFFHPITNLKNELNQVENILNEISNYFKNFDYSDDIYSDYKSNINIAYLSKDLEELVKQINKKMINNDKLKLFGNPGLISNIKQCNIILKELKEGIIFLKESHLLLTNSLKDKIIKRRQEEALFKLIKNIDDIIIIFKCFFAITKTIVYNNNYEIKSKIYKNALIEITKINVLFKSYSFEGYNNLIKEFINKIIKILK